MSRPWSKAAPLPSTAALDVAEGSAPTHVVGAAVVTDVALSLLAAALLWWPAFIEPAATGGDDWPHILHSWELQRVALSRFHEWPLWDPFYCGGVPSLGNPETQHFSPLFGLSFLLGTTLALKLYLVLHTALGWLGMLWFARERVGIAAPAARIVALAWACSGFFAWHGAVGHVQFMPFYCAPLLLVFWQRAQREPVYALGVAGVLTLTLLEGGTYPFPYFLLLLALDAAVRCRGVPELRALLRAGALSLLLTALLGAVRWLPVADAMARMSRLTQLQDALSPLELVRMLTARSRPLHDGAHAFALWEYSAYQGWAPLLLATWGAWLALRNPAQRWLLAGIALFGSLTLGPFAPWAPWTWLHELPVFDSLRVPSRFVVLFTLYLCGLLGLALDAALRRMPARAARFAPWLALAVLGLDLGATNYPAVARFSEPPLQLQPAATRFHYLDEPNWMPIYASLPARNVGVRGCSVDAMNWPLSPALWAADVSQVHYPSATARPSTLAQQRSINRFEATIEAPAPTRVILNQNFDPDWIPNLGHSVSDRGRQAVDVPAGRHQLRLEYRPASWQLAWALEAIGALAALALWLRRHKT